MADRTWPGVIEGRGLSPRALVCATLFVSLLGLAATMPARAEPAVVIPAPAFDPAPPAGTGLQTIVLAGGCFWGPQVVYEHVKGVTRALAGYASGQKGRRTMAGTEMPNRWRMPKSLQVTFDPRQISLGKILQIHFSVAHNPTELNYQGPDVGAQYRSEIFYANDEQKRVAEAYIAQLNAAHVFANLIVTKVEASPGFNPAEGSDQDYAVLHPDDSYVASNDQPKLANLKRLFPDHYRETPLTVSASSKPAK